MKKVFLFVLVTGFMFACSSGGETVKDEVKEEAQVEVQEEVAPAAQEVEAAPVEGEEAAINDTMKTKSTEVEEVEAEEGK